MAPLSLRVDRSSKSSARAADSLARHKFLVEEYLEALTFSDEPRLANLVEAMRYPLLAAGDRVRAVLCMEVAGSFGVCPRIVLPSAAAVELIHTLSVIHSELPALGGRLERTRPACHAKFGEATAILAGDGFLGESLALITTRQRGTPEQLVEVVREVAGATGVEGTFGDHLLRVRQERRALGSATQNGSSGWGQTFLLAASARVGAILAGALPEDRRAISEYARQLCLCLQVAEESPETAAASRGGEPEPTGGPERP